MEYQGIAYFLFGLALVVLLGVIIFFYFARKRRKHVEAPKYRMLDDDE